MGDMDLDELDGPTRAPTRKGKFVPKSSKLVTKPKPEPQPDPTPLPHPKPEPHSVKMEVDSVKSVDKTTVDSAEPVKMDVDGSVEAVSDSVSAEEEEDCVVREIDVYFNPVVDSATQLYVLQYPLRPCWRPYELEDRCVEVRLKPTSSEVEIDLSTDDTNNYDAKETLSTSMKPNSAKGIAIGMLRGNKLHINPVHAAVQLRPSRKPDVSGVPSNKKNVIKSEDLKGENSPGPSRKQSPEFGTLVHDKEIKPPGRPNDADDKVDEDWISLKHHSASSDFSARYLENMTCTESSPIQFSMSPSNYINSICPGANSGNNKSKVLVPRALHSLPLEERFRTWFLEHPCANRFATLQHLAPNIPKEDVFAALKKVACLVQGLWVPKTVGNDARCLARDYILLLFSKSPTISYTQLEKFKTNGKKVMNDLLPTLANERPTLKDWKFKVDPDKQFMKSEQGIVGEQEEIWRKAEISIKKFFETEKVTVTPKPRLKLDVLSKKETSKVFNSKGVVTSSNGAVSKTPMSNETREALPKALLKVFHTHKVCSFQQICLRLREMAVSESARPKGVSREARAAADAVDGPQEELMEIINQFATNIHGVYVLKKSPDDPQFDPLRKVVIDLLLAEGPNAKLKKASILAAAKVQLKRDIPDPEYNKVLKELCVTQGATWVLKRGDGNPSSK